MIEALFKRKYATNAVALLCGALLICLFIFLFFADSEASLKNLFIGVGFGAISCVFGVIGLLWNFNAYLYMDEDGTIKGKYHWFGKIDCRISDVEFALGQVNTLSVQLKSGKIYIIMGIENSRFVAEEIRRRMPFDASGQPEAMLEKLNELKSARKKGIINMCAGYVLMLINILLIAFLLDERDFHEFSKADWFIFFVMGVITIATVVGVFCIADKTGRKNIPIESMQYAVRRTIIETKPLLPGFIIAVYADDDYYERVTVYGYPHLNAVYFTVQRLDAEYDLVRAYSSETYDDEDEFPYEMYSMIDITKRVLH